VCVHRQSKTCVDHLNQHNEQSVTKCITARACRSETPTQRRYLNNTTAPPPPYQNLSLNYSGRVLTLCSSVSCDHNLPVLADLKPALRCHLDDVVERDVVKCSDVRRRRRRAKLCVPEGVPEDTGGRCRASVRGQVCVCVCVCVCA
jgi:hypothetical protein